MTANRDAVEILGLPDSAKVGQRLTKKLLAAQFDASRSDVRFITRAVSSAQVVAILRPETIQVPPYHDDERAVVDIAILDVAFWEAVSGRDRSRLAELLHRSMPRPVVAFLRIPGGDVVLSLALSRPSRTEPERSTIEASVQIPLDDIAADALHISRLNRTDVWALYRDLVRVAAAGGWPGNGAMTAEDAVMLRRRLIELEIELAALVREVKREKNQQRRIDLNARGRDIRSQIVRVRGSLYSTDSPNILDVGGTQ